MQPMVEVQLLKWQAVPVFLLSAGKRTLLLIREKIPYEAFTSAEPSVSKISYSELRLLKGETGAFLRQNGILAFREYNGRLQYVLDLKVIKAKGELK